ncbi:MAG TPA: SHOCT domain-containing protein [Thermoleophilaceae bacterium]|nr:SHOCT domain-containing protein [Thermoleophilaceae bacterium]
MAVASGTATAVSNRVSRRQSRRWAEQGGGQPGYLAPAGGEYYEQPPPEAAAPPPAPAPAADPIAQLKELGELRQQGILTDEEFAAQKAKLLG